MKVVCAIFAVGLMVFAALAQKHPIIETKPAVVTNLPPARVSAFVGKDQFGADFKLAAPFAKPLLITLADQKGAQQTDGWVLPLRERFGDGIAFLAIADVSAVPASMREMIRKKFTEKYAHPSLMDWTGEITGGLNAVRRRCNLYVVAPDGRVLSFHCGDADEAALAKINGVLAGLGVKPAQSGGK